MRLESSYIELNGLHFHAYHGVMAQERLTGGDFKVSLRVRCGVERALATDDVADTISYADLYEIVKREMSIPSRLLEHAAGRIAESVLREMPQVESLCVRLTKSNPPMGAELEGATVEITLKR